MKPEVVRTWADLGIAAGVVLLVGVPYIVGWVWIARAALSL